MTGIDPNLKPVKQGEYTAGIEHELAPTMSLGVRFVHKWLFRTIEDVGVFFQGSEIYLIANPGEGLAVQMELSVPSLITPKPVRKYDALEFRLNRLQVSANIDNVFDQDTWMNYYLLTTQGPSPNRDSLTVANPPALSLYGATGSYNLQQRIAGYTGTMRPNPFYTTPNVYQGRREMHLLARISF